MKKINLTRNGMTPRRIVASTHEEPVIPEVLSEDEDINKLPSDTTFADEKLTRFFQLYNPKGL